MSTVKIKTEPTADIKLEQHSSDIDTKVEPDSEADIKPNDDNRDTNQNQTTKAHKNQRQLICEYIGCDRRFGSVDSLKTHQHEHRLLAELNIRGKTYTLTRQSLNDRWSCLVPGCTSTTKTAKAAGEHIRMYHAGTMINHQSPSQKTRRKLYFHDVDNFYVNGVRCGYHNTTGVFICHECKLVPECLLIHLQQTHGYDEKSIDNAFIPDSAKITRNDPNGNQHTSNSYLAAAIRQPYQQHHQGIVRGWICIAPDCGYCSYTVDSKRRHKNRMHQGEQITTISALVLRLHYAKIHTSCYLISRLNTTANDSTEPANSASEYNIDDDDDDDDDDELVLSDYSDEDSTY